MYTTQFNDHSISPILVEPGMKYFINMSLKDCHEVKTAFNNSLYNISLAFLFIFILACILLYKYKGKPTLQELKQKNIIKQNYILSKIKQTQKDKQKLRGELITGLPNSNNDFENIN